MDKFTTGQKCWFIKDSEESCIDVEAVEGYILGEVDPLSHDYLIAVTSDFISEPEIARILTPSMLKSLTVDSNFETVILSSDELGETEDEAYAKHYAKSKQIVNEYKDEIDDIGDLLNFMFDHDISGGEDYDRDARIAAIIKAEELGFDVGVSIDIPSEYYEDDDFTKAIDELSTDEGLSL